LSYSPYIKKYIPNKVVNMRSLFQLFFITILLFSIAGTSVGQSQINSKNNLLTAKFVSLEGEVYKKKNIIVTNGNVQKYNSPVIHLIRTKSKSPQGTFLLLTDGGYNSSGVINVDESMARFLNIENFNVAILEYHILNDSQTSDLALADALKAFRYLKSNQKALGLKGDRSGIIALSGSGHLAARAVQRLDDKEQPDELILINPTYLNETIAGTVFPEIMPPLKPTARLLCTFSSDYKKEWISSAGQYTKIWIGYDGDASFLILNDTIDSKKRSKDDVLNPELTNLIKAFLKAAPEKKPAGINPAATAVAGWGLDRHNEKLALTAKNKYDLIFIGNSITHNFEKPEYLPVWNQFYAPRKALNLGYSGYRTENLLWNIQNGELDGQSPKVIVIEIGTNNIDEYNYPTRHTAGQLAGGIEEIVKLVREKLPDTKILLLRCFPGCYGGPNPTSHRAILERASDITSKFADGKNVFYCDVNHAFLEMDGSINHELMPDWLHPSPAGAKLWGQAMEPLLSQLMRDKSLDRNIPANSAIVPAPKLEHDSYDWWARHSEVLSIKDSVNPEIVLIGNSITHFWGGIPSVRDAKGKLSKPNGPATWETLFGNYRVLNLGFGWDRTQNVLWRLDHGEIDALHPRIVIINIGTNNTSGTENARINTAPEIVEGIRAICTRVRSKIPGAKIILMAVFPREQNPTHPRRMLINEINEQLEIFSRINNITFIDLGPYMLAPDGTLPKEIASDFCHPTEKGYQIWAETIKSFISEP
jgi:lysophospholipase L1-like esterase/acetyl esterase/lipase